MIAPVRTDLPTGTVTFLFTDVEGSTKLAARAGRRGVRAGAGGASPDPARGVRGRSGASRSTRRATPSSSPSRLRPARSGPPPRHMAGLACGPDPGADGHPYGDAAPGRGGLRRSRRASGGPDRCLWPRRAGAGLGLDRCACGHGRAARPGRAPAEGPVGAGADLPARGRRLPAAQEPAPNEPAHPRDALPGPRAGAATRCTSWSREQTSAC